MEIKNQQLNYQQIQDPIIRDNFMKLSLLIEQIIEQVNQNTKDIEEVKNP